MQNRKIKPVQAWTNSYGSMVYEWDSFNNAPVLWQTHETSSWYLKERRWNGFDLHFNQPRTQPIFPGLTVSIVTDTHACARLRVPRKRTQLCWLPRASVFEHELLPPLPSASLSPSSSASPLRAAPGSCDVILARPRRLEWRRGTWRVPRSRFRHQ